MSDTALRLALREVHMTARSPVFWMVLAVIVLVLGISGPFGTFESMSLALRLGYWAVVVPATALTGWLVAGWVVLAFELRHWPLWCEALAAGAAVAVAVTGVVHGLNALLVGLPLWSLDTLLAQAPGTPLVGLAVTAGLVWTERRAALPYFQGPPAVTNPPSAPAARLLARLPFEKRGTLVSLSVQDHYTEVTTSSGRALVLLRLSDAMAEAEGVPGLQIHRSHWVALSAVARVRRDGARVVLTLNDGREVKVSRTYLPDVRGAGLL